MFNRLTTLGASDDALSCRPQELFVGSLSAASWHQVFFSRLAGASLGVLVEVTSGPGKCANTYHGPNQNQLNWSRSWLMSMIPPRLPAQLKQTLFAATIPFPPVVRSLSSSATARQVGLTYLHPVCTHNYSGSADSFHVTHVTSRDKTAKGVTNVYALGGKTCVALTAASQAARNDLNRKHRFNSYPLTAGRTQLRACSENQPRKDHRPVEEGLLALRGLMLLYLSAAVPSGCMKHLTRQYKQRHRDPATPCLFCMSDEGHETKRYSGRGAP